MSQVNKQNGHNWRIFFCSLISSKLFAKSILVFTVSWKKFFFECQWPRGNHRCCLWAEQLRQIITWLVPCWGMTEPPKIRQALPNRSISAMLLSSWGNLASRQSEPLNVMIRIEMNCFKWSELQYQIIL
jgi:hypothetical protein